MVGILSRIIFLGIVNSLGFWAGSHLLVSRNWAGLVWTVVTTLAIDYIYISKRAKASRWLLPGTILLVIFQIYPVIFTATAAFSNYSTDHFVTREEAIQGVVSSFEIQVEGSPQYEIRPIHKDSETALLIKNPDTGEFLIGTDQGVTTVSDPGMDANGMLNAPEGWSVYSDDELSSSAVYDKLTTLKVPVANGNFIKVNDFTSAFEFNDPVIYDEAKDKLVRPESGYVFEERRGNFIDEDGTVLNPGWKVNVGFDNFRSVISDPVVRGPFLRVLIWTFVYAGLSVLTTFILGLTLALILNHPGVRGRKFLRSTLIIPYAMPGFLSIMIWAGFLNDDFGIVNNLFGTHIPWLSDVFWAKVSTLLVNLWLGFPYMFLICTGAIQSIPAELPEAASVDGATPRQILTKIKLPLLLVTVSPLLIGSFAYNFNNFGGIYLLTGGGPAMEDSQIAGGTDILISYTYKLAIEAGHGNDYGLACAISILIFFIVATISTVSFTRTRALENLN